MPLPSSPSDQQKLKNAIVEITNCMLRMDSERDQIKEIINDVADTYDIDKKQVRKIATTMYKSNYADVQEENREFETLYETLIEGRKTGEAA